MDAFTKWAGLAWKHKNVFFEMQSHLQSAVNEALKVVTSSLTLAQSLSSEISPTHHTIWISPLLSKIQKMTTRFMTQNFASFSTEKPDAQKIRQQVFHSILDVLDEEIELVSEQKSPESKAELQALINIRKSLKNHCQNTLKAESA